MSYPESWNDPDHIERRGRPRKDKPAGIVTVSVELSPESVAIIKRVQQSRRELGGGVPSRSEIIAAGLVEFEKVNNDSVERIRLSLDREVTEPLRVLDNAYRRAGVEIDNDWRLIRRVLIDAAESVS